MTFIDVLAALIIITLFIFGFSQACWPVYRAWAAALEAYKTARTISFVAESFRRECASPDRNIERWKKIMLTAPELESYELTELWHGEILRALKAACIISGEPVEIIGVCTP